MSRTFSVDQLADRFQVDREVVTAWIRAGELAAVNVCVKPNTKKPRWRVTEDGVASFEKRRAVAPPASVRRKRRLSKASASPWAEYG